MLQNLLSQCIHLSLLISLQSPNSYNLVHPSQEYITIDDSHVVFMDGYTLRFLLEDWEEGAYGRFGFWDLQSASLKLVVVSIFLENEGNGKL